MKFFTVFLFYKLYVKFTHLPQCVHDVRYVVNAIKYQNEIEYNLWYPQYIIYFYLFLF